MTLHHFSLITNSHRCKKHKLQNKRHIFYESNEKHKKHEKYSGLFTYCRLSSSVNSMQLHVPRV